MIGFLRRSKEVKPENVAKPVLSALRWQEQEDGRWVAYPMRDWDKYTVFPEHFGGWTARLTGYRFVLTLGCHETMQAAMNACDTDNRKRA